MERREVWSDERTGEVLGYVRFDAKGPADVRDQAVEGRRARRASAGRSPSSSPTGWLVLDFLTWSRDVKKNTAKWVHSQKLYLDGWKKKLGRVDLRRLSYTDRDCSRTPRPRDLEGLPGARVRLMWWPRVHALARYLA